MWHHGRATMAGTVSSGSTLNGKSSNCVLSHIFEHHQSLKIHVSSPSSRAVRTTTVPRHVLSNMQRSLRLRAFECRSIDMERRSFTFVLPLGLNAVEDS